MKYGRPLVQITGRRNTLFLVSISLGSRHFVAAWERVSQPHTSFVPQRRAANEGVAANRHRPRTRIARFMGTTLGSSALTNNERHRGVLPGRCHTRPRTFPTGHGTHYSWDRHFGGWHCSVASRRPRALM